MHRLLKETGSIFLQMDYRISHWVRLILDEIFGDSNFKNEIVWCYSKMNNSNNSFTNNHDVIFSYGKDTNLTKFNNIYEDIESALKRRLRRFVSEDNKIYFKSVKNHSSQLMDNYINSTINKLGRELEDDDVVIDFKSKDKAKIDDVWYIPIIKGNSKENVEYDTQKPKELLKRIVSSSTNKGDTVADFFMGSGTTLVVAKELGRNYIGCDINERAVKITKERLEEIK